MNTKIRIRNRPFFHPFFRLQGCLIIVVFVLGIGIGLTGCQSQKVLPTIAAIAPALETPTTVSTLLAAPTPPSVPVTWTPQSRLALSNVLSTTTQVPTSTPRATKTPFPTLLPTLTLTSSPRPVVTAEPITATPAPPEHENLPPPIPVNPIMGENLLLNGSFEDGHYNMHGIPELQLPVGWKFEWDEGRTGFGSESWDIYVRPETRVLSTEFLPPAEHSLFIFDGSHTIKAFKGNGAISFKLFQDIYLEPGTYVLEINLYPDMYMDYQDGLKIWADDPLTGQFRFIAPEATGWMGTVYGRKNRLTHTFTVDTAGQVPIGVALRGNHAIMNDGWFLDDWSLRRVEN